MFTLGLCIKGNVWCHRGFNKHQWPTKHVGHFAQWSHILFSLKEEVTSAHSVVNKTYITKFVWNCKRSLVLSYVLVANAVFQSVFHIFLCRFMQNLFSCPQMYVVVIIVICSLLVRVMLIVWLINRILNKSYLFLRDKHTLLYSI